MKALLQRVTSASVSIDGIIRGKCSAGLLVLLGVRNGDSEQDARKLANKTARLRIFPDQEGRMNRSLLDIGGEALVISQFTLYAGTRKGNRPDFVRAAEPELAERLYSLYVDALSSETGRDRVASGVFGAHMVVELINDGPVTIELCTDMCDK